uniref:Uncharacterized protein n=2 Tax=Tetranychus urticae TaxID=32264 RepID=T1JV03_TETUR
MSSDDLLIKAHITHKESNNTWYLAETVYFNPFINGVVKIQKGDTEMQVHYNLNTSKRIVFLDNRAMEMESIRDFTWDGVQLPKSTIRLINKLLILGPVSCYSFLLDHSYKDYEGVRSLEFVSNNYNELLLWVYKFSENKIITPWVALSELEYIIIANLSNGDADVITMQIEKFVILDSIAIETGQQFYVGFNETLTDHIHQSTVDIQFNSTKDTVIPISWMKHARQGINYEQVDELGSDSRFTSKTNGCAIQSSNRNESFNFVSLSLQEFFGIAWTFRYTKEILFPIKYQHRNELIMDKIDFDKKIGKFSYDLVITALRVARMPGNISSDVILQNLQIERKFYNKENKSPLEYRLVKTQKTFFSGYTKLNYEPGHQAYALNNNGFQDAKMDVLALLLSPSKDAKFDILKLQLSPSTPEKLSTMETFTLFEKLDELGENLKELICFKLGISNLRIKLVQLQFDGTYLLASVVIMERSNIVDLLRHRKLDLSELVNLLYSDIETCLKLEAMKLNFSKIISCNDISHGCIGITLDQPLPDENENGSNCVIYNNLDKSLYKLVQEPPLRELKMSYKHLNETKLFSVKLSFDLHVIDPSQNYNHSSIATDSLNEKVVSKNYFGHYVFRILIVAAICAVIGFTSILGKLYRRNVQISSSPSIALLIFKD